MTYALPSIHLRLSAVVPGGGQDYQMLVWAPAAAPPPSHSSLPQPKLQMPDSQWAAVTAPMSDRERDAARRVFSPTEMLRFRKMVGGGAPDEERPVWAASWGPDDTLSGALGSFAARCCMTDFRCAWFALAPCAFF